MLYVFYITTTLTYHVIVIVIILELYDFYYTAITLTAGYKYLYYAWLV